MPELPLMIQLLFQADLVKRGRVKDLLLKLKESPSKTVSDVLLESGVVDSRQLQSLQLAEDLLCSRTT
jgi:hypothetical protein